MKSIHTKLKPFHLRTSLKSKIRKKHSPHIDSKSEHRPFSYTSGAFASSTFARSTGMPGKSKITFIYVDIIDRLDNANGATLRSTQILKALKQLGDVECIWLGKQEQYDFQKYFSSKNLGKDSIFLEKRIKHHYFSAKLKSNGWTLTQKEKNRFRKRFFSNGTSTDSCPTSSLSHNDREKNIVNFPNKTTNTAVYPCVKKILFVRFSLLFPFLQEALTYLQRQKQAENFQYWLDIDMRSSWLSEQVWTWNRSLKNRYFFFRAIKEKKIETMISKFPFKIFFSSLLEKNNFIQTHTAKNICLSVWLPNPLDEDCDAMPLPIDSSSKTDISKKMEAPIFGSNQHAQLSTKQTTHENKLVSNHPQKKYILFFGDLTSQVNIQALNFLLGNIMPNLDDFFSQKKWQLLIAGLTGRKAKYDTEKKAQTPLEQKIIASSKPFSNVYFLGQVQQIDSLIAYCTALFLPLPFFAGIPTRILQAGKHGKPILASQNVCDSCSINYLWNIGEISAANKQTSAMEIAKNTEFILTNNSTKKFQAQGKALQKEVYQKHNFDLFVERLSGCL